MRRYRYFAKVHAGPWEGRMFMCDHPLCCNEVVIGYKEEGTRDIYCQDCFDSFAFTKLRKPRLDPMAKEAFARLLRAESSDYICWIVEEPELFKAFESLCRRRFVYLDPGEITICIDGKDIEVTKENGLQAYSVSAIPYDLCEAMSVLPDL